MAIGATQTCPSTVSKANWYGSDTYADTFSVAQSGSTITVTRTDAPGALWGMNLQFYCCPGEMSHPPYFRLYRFERVRYPGTHTQRWEEEARYR